MSDFDNLKKPYSTTDPIVRAVESPNPIASTIRRNQKPATELLGDYLSYMKNHFKNVGVNVTEEVFSEEGRTKAVLKLFKNDVYKGQLRRTFEEVGVELSKVELEGKTGLLRGIYERESELFAAKGVPVKTNLVNPITQKMFAEHYSNATNWGNKTMWRPSEEAIEKALPIVEQRMAFNNNFTQAINTPKQIAEEVIPESLRLNRTRSLSSESAIITAAESSAGRNVGSVKAAGNSEVLTKILSKVTKKI